jgi:hypothetical protein
MTSRFSRVTLGITFVAVLASGCSSSNKGSDPGAPTANDALQQVANMIRDYSSTAGRPPAKLADLSGLKNLYNIGYKAVETGEIVVVWGTPVAGEGGGGGGTGVVAYEKSAADSSGAVLLQDGTVKQMSADEFRAAKR